MALALITILQPARAAAAALLLALLLSDASQASGGGPADVFVQRQRPDMPRPAYLQGELGLLLPSFGRVHLYVAWRALASADAGLPHNPLSLEAFELACCDAGAAQESWGDTPYAPAKPWLEARTRVQAQPPRRLIGALKPVGQDAWEQFLNCPPDSFRFATETLTALQQRSDATPARLRSWVQAQDQVFEFCSYSGAGLPPWRRNEAPAPIPVAPEDLPGSEPLHWRQARSYQQAAAAFYAGDWERAIPAFGRIATDSRHPWQAWAALAELRGVLRQASLQGKLVQEPAAAARALLERLRQMERLIAAHPGWTVQQRAAGEMLNLAEGRLQPRQRLAALSDELVRLDQPLPKRALADWARLADAQLDYKPGAVIQEFRKVMPFLDWAATLQQCGHAQPGARSQAVAHAKAAWQTRPGTLWLIPLLSCANGVDLSNQKALWQDLQQAIDATPAGHPAMLTLRWQWVRLLREAGESDRARAVLAPLLRAAPTSISTSNLLQMEALALARTLDEAVPWLARRSVGWRDPDTGATGSAAKVQGVLSGDGAQLITTRLSLAEWEQLLHHPQLAPNLRQPLAIALFWRAELLGQEERARRTAMEIVRREPSRRPAFSGYLAAKDPEMRREALWRINLTQPLPARVFAGTTHENEFSGGVVTKTTWCKLDGVDAPYGEWYETDALPSPAVFPSAPELADEQTALKRIGTSAGAFSQWLLDRAKREPLPVGMDRLLHAGVQASRGWCTGPDNAATSQAMFRLLHQRFPASPWTKKTPYWYR